MRTTIFLLVLVLAGSPLLYSQNNFDQVILESAIDIQLESDYPIHKIAAFDSLIWASDYGSGTIFKSIDQGKTFKKLTRLGSEYFEQIQFLDATKSFICGDYGYVYKTTDGGTTWIDISPPLERRIKERYRNDSTKNQQPDGAFAAYYSMYFISETKGYVSGFTYNPKEGRDSFKSLFYLTENGGATWQLMDKIESKSTIESFKRMFPEKGSIIENEHFIDKDMSWKVARNSQKQNIAIKANYRTQTKDTVLLPQTSYDRVMLRSIAFTTNEYVFIFGGSFEKDNEKAVIYQTNNGGLSWDYIPSSLAHIHAAKVHEGYLLLFGKYNLMKRIALTALLPKNTKNPHNE